MIQAVLLVLALCRFSADAQIECPRSCLGQGFCLDGKCICFSGFTGDDCSEKQCVNGCANGRCESGVCVCNEGYLPPFCLSRGCTDNCNGHGSCRIEADRVSCLCSDGFTGEYCEKASILDCPNDCSGHGICRDGQCYCQGRTGPDCSILVCPLGCSGRGICHTETGQCDCLDKDSYFGEGCQLLYCKPKDCNSRGVCDYHTGLCTCNSFSFGPECSWNCRDNCNKRGLCQTPASPDAPDGKCQCQEGWTGNSCEKVDCGPNWTGENCDIRQCPNNCTGRGYCDKQDWSCACLPPWTGADCSLMTCPGQCSHHGRCANGTCLCALGWEGADCSKEVPTEELSSDSNEKSKTSEEPKPEPEDSEPIDKEPANSDKQPANPDDKEPANPDDKESTNSDDQTSPVKEGGDAVAALEASQRVSRREIRTGLNSNSNSELEDIPNASSVPSVTPTTATVVQTTHRLSCDPPCSSRGYCVAVGGTPQCFCQDGWTGVACEKASRGQIQANYKHQIHS